MVDGQFLYGPSVTMKKPGSVMTVAAGTITGFQSVAEGASVPIPAGGTYLAKPGRELTVTLQVFPK